MLDALGEEKGEGKGYKQLFRGVFFFGCFSFQTTVMTYNIFPGLPTVYRSYITLMLSSIYLY